MSTEDWAIALITAAAVAANLFVILYATTAPWWRSVFGRALMTGEVALAILLDVVLYAHWAHKLVPIWLGLTIYSAIAAGCWMRLGAVVHEQLARRRDT